MIQAKDSSEIITEAFILKNKTKHWGVELSSLLAVQRGSELGGAFCRQGIIQQTAEPDVQ